MVTKKQLILFVLKQDAAGYFIKNRTPRRPAAQLSAVKRPRRIASARPC